MIDAKQVAELAAKGTQGEWVADCGDIIPRKVKEDEPIATLYAGSKSPDAHRIANVPAMEALIAKQAARIAELEGALGQIEAIKLTFTSSQYPIPAQDIARAALQGEQQ